MGRIFKTGAGWRLGWDADAPEFSALVGSDDWAIELTAAEFEDFCRLAERLDQTIRAIASELMDEEKIACEVESELLWLEADGYPNAYGLRLIVQSHRAGEGYWPATAVPSLLQTLPLLRIF
jgi:hypothetical protein